MLFPPDRFGGDLAELCSGLPRELVVLPPFESAWILAPALNLSELVLMIHVNAFPAKLLFDLQVVEIVAVLPSCDCEISSESTDSTT